MNLIKFRKNKKVIIIAVSVITVIVFIVGLITYNCKLKQKKLTAEKPTRPVSQQTDIKPTGLYGSLETPIVGGSHYPKRGDLPASLHFPLSTPSSQYPFASTPISHLSNENDSILSTADFYTIDYNQLKEFYKENRELVEVNGRYCSKFNLLPMDGQFFIDKRIDKLNIEDFYIFIYIISDVIIYTDMSSDIPPIPKSVKEYLKRFIKQYNINYYHQTDYDDKFMNANEILKKSINHYKVSLSNYIIRNLTDQKTNIIFTRNSREKLISCFNKLLKISPSNLKRVLSSQRLETPLSISQMLFTAIKKSKI